LLRNPHYAKPQGEAESKKAPLVLQATLPATYRSSGEGEPTTSQVTKPGALKVRRATDRDQVLTHGVSGNHRTSSTCHNDTGLWYAPLKLIVIRLVDITINIFVLSTILIIVFVGVVISVTIIVPSYVSMSPIVRCQDSTVSLFFVSQV